MPVSEKATSLTSEGSAATRATVLQLFATPVARTHCPFADDVNGRLAGLLTERAGEGAKEFGYKKETAGEFTQWGGTDAVRLSRWVCAVAGKFTESLTGTSLTEAFGRSLEREAERDASHAQPVAVGVTRSWASLYRSGDRHEPHFHPNTALSAVYYVAAPGTCELDVLDPRPNVDYYDPGISIAGESHRFRLACSPGELLVFPGWLKHAVPPFQDEKPRMSIAWNLNYTLG
ncbi:TIGR02466 family protein [Streptomyces sp. NPDC102282]|uniref:TIGR02466 family protein n=1 Tax=Streptomyces sp. NPDC102282 TaxID=3366154 RepID=UPI0037F643A2